MKTWQLQEAKAKLSEVVKRAQTHGPQEITVHGKGVAVVLSKEGFDKLNHSGESFAAFMRRSPLAGLENLRLERDKSTARDVEL